MNLFFSICSNNYLAQVIVLYKSLKKFHPETGFFLFLCDQKSSAVDYSQIADEVIELDSIEPRFGELALKYNIIELNTSLKPRIFEYLFTERKITQAVFLDPDIKFYHSVSFLFTDFIQANILLTPHIYSPIPPDGKKPDEQSFLMFGIYNLGFISVRNTEESIRFLQWWKSRTYEFGYADTYKGIFVDQLPVNLVPLFFKSVFILEDRGMNMAPWNLHERWLDNRNGDLFVNRQDRLKFYHFSSFITGEPELPQHYYNRFLLKDRPDLQQIYIDYNKELLSAGYMTYQHLENAYTKRREEHLRKIRKNKWVRKFLP